MTRKYLTKREALAIFKEHWEEEDNQRWHGDIVAKREAWNNFTDYLCKDRQISPKQYETWTNPF